MSQSESVTSIPMETTSPSLMERVTVRLAGNKAKELERFIKFAVVGFSGTAVNAIVLNALMILFHVQQGDDASRNLFEAFAYAIAIFNNFVWNRLWVYPDSRSKPVFQQLVMFYAINGIGFLINMVIFAFSSGPFASLLLNVSHSMSPDTAAKLGADMGLLLATAIVMFWNFFVNRYITYNDVK